MAGKVSPTLRVLLEIRDELKGTNVRLERVEGRVGSLEAQQRETEIRIATELIGVARAVGEVRDLLRDRSGERHRVDDLERRLSVVEKRVG